MNEIQVKMMQEYGALVLPEEIDHDAYMLVVEALHLAKSCGHDELVFYCAGLGGEVNSALAIVDLIQAHGDVIGLLPGQADSSHAYVWLGCRERYVYPYASMGLHETKFIYQNGATVDRRFTQNFLGDVTSYNYRICRLLSDATTPHRPIEFWETQLSDIGSVGVRHYDDGELIRMGIAKAIGAYTPLQHDNTGIDVRGVAVDGVPMVNLQNGQRWESASTEQLGVMYGLQDFSTEITYQICGPHGARHNLMYVGNGMFKLVDTPSSFHGEVSTNVAT